MKFVKSGTEKRGGETETCGGGRSRESEGRGPERRRIENSGKEARERSRKGEEGETGRERELKKEKLQIKPGTQWWWRPTVAVAPHSGGGGRGVRA